MTTLDWRQTAVSVREPAVGVAAQIVLLVALWAGFGLSPVGWLAGMVYAVILSGLLTGAMLRSGTRSLGPADHVTLARAELVGATTALVAAVLAGGEIPAAPIVVLASVVLALDALDGHVARRTRTASPLGARFDMEVDAFLILVLSVFVARSAGAWVLAIGAMRYAFVAAAWVAPWLRGPLPPSYARKVTAAVQGIALTVAGSGLLPPPVTAGVAGLALAMLVWSFGRDILWLWRNRP